jgi:hypothetical protein
VLALAEYTSSSGADHFPCLLSLSPHVVAKIRGSWWHEFAARGDQGWKTKGRKSLKNLNYDEEVLRHSMSTYSILSASTSLTICSCKSIYDNKTLKKYKNCITQYTSLTDYKYTLTAIYPPPLNLSRVVVEHATSVQDSKRPANTQTQMGIAWVKTRKQR